MSKNRRNCLKKQGKNRFDEVETVFFVKILRGPLRAYRCFSEVLLNNITASEGRKIAKFNSLTPHFCLYTEGSCPTKTFNYWTKNNNFTYKILSVNFGNYLCA